MAWVSRQQLIAEDLLVASWQPPVYYSASVVKQIILVVWNSRKNSALSPHYYVNMLAREPVTTTLWNSHKNSASSPHYNMLEPATTTIASPNRLSWQGRRKDLGHIKVSNAWDKFVEKRKEEAATKSRERNDKEAG
jgi:hypothetical protein